MFGRRKKKKREEAEKPAASPASDQGAPPEPVAPPMPPAPPELPEGMAATTVLDMTALAVEAPSDEELLLEEVDVLPTGALQPVESFDPSPTPLPQRPAADVDFDWPSLDKDQAGVSDDLQAVPTSLFSQSAESGKSETPPLPQGQTQSPPGSPTSA